MPLVKTTSNYSSDEIAALTGFDGTEPKDVSSWCRKYEAEFAARVVFALNQHYPELQSGHYFNKALVALVQESIGRSGLSVVIEDNYRKEGVVPVEPPASLEYADDYLLVDDTLRICGRLRVWESLGGKSTFYHDKVLLDVLTESKLAVELLRTVREHCGSRHIVFTEAEGNTKQPERFGSTVFKLIRHG